MAHIIDGKALARRIESELAVESEAMKKAFGRAPGLAVVLVGDDPASQVYVRNKARACARAGIESFEHRLPAQTSEDELIALIDRLNADEAVDGILVQLPLPRGLSAQTVIERISPDKDVDGFHPTSAGALMIGRKEKGFRPCTPAGVMALLEEAQIDPSGKNAVVLGRSNIVGKPAALMLLEADATVTIAHSRTQNLPELLKQADIVVAAVGRPKMITGGMIKPGAVVIDVGINRLSDGSLAGDVDFASVKDVAGAVTPVPGGVGPMTIAMLMKNTLTAAKRRLSQQTPRHA